MDRLRTLVFVLAWPFMALIVFLGIAVQEFVSAWNDGLGDELKNNWRALWSRHD